MPLDPKQLEHFPLDPGVYLMKNRQGKVIYVGKAKQLKVRLKQYFSASGDQRPMIPFLLAEIDHIDTLVVPSEKEALLVENELIKKHKPKYNAILKDDKTYISLMVNHKHQWPMVKLVRYKGSPKEDGLYFGPYTSAYAARQTYELITKIFPLRQCSNEELKRRTRPCLLYSIKRCIAPCVGLCSKEEYNAFVQGAVEFLKGHDKGVLKNLYSQMEEASENLEYEKAAALLTTIRQIEHVTQSERLVFKTTGKDTDVLALYRQADDALLMQLFFREGKLTGSEHYSFSHVAQEDEEIYSSFIVQHYKNISALPSELLIPLSLKDHKALEELLQEKHRRKVLIHTPIKGEKLELILLAQKNAKAAFLQEKDHSDLKEKMLLDLQDKLKLNRYPKRIECFDTSNIAGSAIVASLVAYTEGEKDKKRTRLFHIKTVTKGDDYGAMREVLTRRLTRAKEEEDLPDLVIVDGGKGQLNIALDVFKQLDIANVDLIALAKEEARHDKGMTLERVFLPHQSDAIHLPPRSALLFLLQKIRDYAHEKAIEFHRKSREKKTFTSALDAIPGIGPTKKKKLLKHFGSVKRIFSASKEELEDVAGIQQKDIEAIHHAAHLSQQKTNFKKA